MEIKKEIFNILKENLNVEELLLEDLAQELIEVFLNKKHYLSDDIRIHLESFFEEDIWTDYSLISKDIAFLLKSK